MVPNVMTLDMTIACLRSRCGAVRWLLAIWIAWTIANLTCDAVCHANDSPNVVLVITDDQGYGDLSCHGNPLLKTPSLDELHRDSIRLTNYHVSPTCSPTRAALLTGHYTNRTGAWHTILGRSLLRENEVTLGQIFKDSGYRTGMFGKWHLGDNYPFRPEDRGFDEVMRHGGGGVGQTPDYWDNAYFDGSYFHNGQVTPVKGFCTDVWFDYAKRFIESCRQADQPFFAYIATNAPHGPMHAPPEYSEPYRESQNVATANFLGMIAHIDHNVGKLRTYLEEAGLADNTIFIFTTDNGTAAGERIFNAGMRGKKGSPYEGGHRVPFMIHWPNGNLVGGKDVSTLTAHVDVVPTLIDLCKLTRPDGVRFDGTNLRTLLTGGRLDERFLVTDSQRVRHPIKWKSSAVMSQRWRLINGKELYDIQADPGQERDLAQQHPEVVKQARDFYEAWWEEIAPSFAEDCRIYLGHPAENPATLTCHDWITDGATPWNQAAIRSGQRGPNVTGFWNVHVDREGWYEIELRRWPQEAATALEAPLAPAADVPGVQAYRARPGKSFAITKASVQVGEQLQTKSVTAGSESVTLKMRLKAGPTTLTTRFYTQAGEELGAYYAYVKRLEE